MSGKIRLEKVFETLGSRLVQTTPRFHAASVVMATPGDAIAYRASSFAACFSVFGFSSPPTELSQFGL